MDLNYVTPQLSAPRGGKFREDHHVTSSSVTACDHVTRFSAGGFRPQALAPVDRVERAPRQIVPTRRQSGLTTASLLKTDQRTGTGVRRAVVNASAELGRTLHSGVDGQDRYHCNKDQSRGEMRTVQVRTQLHKAGSGRSCS